MSPAAEAAVDFVWDLRRGWKPRPFKADLRVESFRRSLRSGCGHGLAYGHLEDLNVLAEGLEVQAAEFGEVLLQVRGKIDSPARLNDPYGVAWFEIVGLHEALPLLGEIVCPKHPCGSKVAGDDLVAAAGKLFEVGGCNLQRNGALLAQIVAEGEVGLVVGEDKFGGLNIFANEIDGIRHVASALVGALHSRLTRFAEDDAGQ